MKHIAVTLLLCGLFSCGSQEKKNYNPEGLTKLSQEKNKDNIEQGMPRTKNAASPKRASQQPSHTLTHIHKLTHTKSCTHAHTQPTCTSTQSKHTRTKRTLKGTQWGTALERSVAKTPLGSLNRFMVRTQPHSYPHHVPKSQDSVNKSNPCQVNL